MSYGKMLLNSLSKCTSDIGAPQDHTVYVLVQEKQRELPGFGQGSRTFYTGVTTNLKRRLIQHNTGATRSTSGIQWSVCCFIPGFTKRQAYIVERYLKRGDTRVKRTIFCDWAIQIDAGVRHTTQYWEYVYQLLLQYGRFGENMRERREHESEY